MPGALDLEQLLVLGAGGFGEGVFGHVQGVGLIQERGHQL